MIIGEALGAFADGGGTAPESVATPFAILADDPNRIPLYLVIASPYDPDTAGTTDLYYSTGPFTSDAGDTPANETFVENRLADPVALTNNLRLNQGSLQAQGTTAGDIVFQALNTTTADPFTDVDDLASYLWDDRDIRILIGLEDYTLAQFAEIFVGTAEGVRWQNGSLSVYLRSPRFRLERDIQTTLYAKQEVTGTDISFTATTTIGSTSTDLSVFPAGMLIRVSGSGSNDGFYTVGSSTSTSITLSGGTVVNESAGASVTIVSALEGGVELEGKTKPLIYGQVRQFSPVLVNSTYLLHQVHDGAIQAVGAVRDRGVALSFDADYADGRLLAEAAVAAGDYSTCLAEGLIKLGDSPVGILTCDIQGDNSGILGASGYTSTAADIIRKIVTTKGSLTDPGDLETGTFTDLNTTNSAVVGVATRLNRATIAEVADAVADSVGAFLDWTRSGRLRVARLEDPTTATAKYTITQVEAETLGAQSADVPTHQVKLGYRHYPQVFSGEEAAGSLDDDTRLDYGQAFRDVTASDSSILTLHPSSDVYEVQTLIDTAAAAQTEATRRLALYSETRHVYTVDVWNGLYKYELGDVVALQLPRWDLSSGKNFAVIGIRERPKVSADEHLNIATLVLWGREN